MIPKNFDLDPIKQRHRWVKNAGLPVDLVGVRLRRIKQGPWSTGSMQLVTDWLDHYKSGDGPRGKGLLLAGRAGRGKTTLAAALLQEALLTAPNERLEHHPEKGRMALQPARFVAFARLLAMMQQQMRPGDWTEALLEQQWKIDAMMGEHPNELANTKLLVLDDVGKEHTTSSKWAEDTFDRLLRTREAAGWPTILTTNVLPENWTGIYGEAMGSFLHQAFDVVLLGTAVGDLRRIQ